MPASSKTEANPDRLQLALQATGIGIWDFDLTSGALYWSTNNYAHFGITDGTEISFETVLEVIHPDDRPRIEKQLKKALDPANGGCFDEEYRIIGKEDQQLRWVKVTGKASFTKEGLPKRFIGTTTDITSIKTAQNEAQKKDALLANITSVAPVVLWVTDEKGNATFLNQTWENWTGLSPEETIKKGWAKAVYFKDRQTLYKDFFKNLKDPKPFELEFRLVHKNGTVCWCISKGRPNFTPEGTFTGFTGSIINISKRKAIEESLKEKNTELQQLIQEFEFVTNSIPQMVWTAQPDGKTDFLNRQSCIYSGLTYEQIKDLGWTTCLHPDDMERTRTEFYRASEAGDVYEIEYRLRRHDGQYRWFISRAFPMKDEKGRIVKWFGACTDIHEKKTLNDILEKKVQERTKELQEANENLERSNAELEQFAYVASHDLQEPLRKIRTFMNMLDTELETGDKEKAKTHISRAMHASGRMRELITDLLHFSRLNQMKEETFETTDLNQILQHTKEDLELLIIQKEAKIKQEELPVIDAIPLQIGQLFYNLLSNALKFSKEDMAPVVHIGYQKLSAATVQKLYPKLKANGPYYQITFTDNGIGFSQQYAQQIFTIFQRLHARSTYEGTGIGLALCKKIAANHHGEIYAESQEGQGASFHVILPAQQKQDSI